MGSPVGLGTQISADYPQMRLRRSPPNTAGLPQIIKNKLTPHLQLPFRSQISAYLSFPDIITHIRISFSFICVGSPYSASRERSEHLWEICGYLRPEPYGRVGHPHLSYNHDKENLHLQSHERDGSLRCEIYLLTE